jgi:Ca2+:H+ antiporter
MGVIPFTVIVAWMAGRPLSLLFDFVETSSLVLAVFVAFYVIIDGKSNWLEGVVLMTL